MAYSDDFNLQYEHPQVDNVIVGFSGIDPQKKTTSSEGGTCSCDPSNLTDAQKQIVRQIIREALSVIDFSNCECDPTSLTDAQKDIINKFIDERISEIEACDCDHSSLSDEQKEIIKNIIDERLQELIINYDGGKIDDEPAPEPEPITPITAGDFNHEELNNLLGGDNNGHFHLTKEELLKLAAYPDFSDIKHEVLPDLLGGDLNGHFHLTDDELRKLKIMIAVFFPDGSDELIIKPVSPDHVDPLDEFDPYGGLPSGIPPAWEINMLPSDYTIYEGCQKMYYGKHYISSKGEQLIVPLVYKNASGEFRLMRFSNFSAIDSALCIINTSNYGGVISDYFYDDNYTTSYLYLALGDSGKAFLAKPASAFVAIYTGQGYWNSICYSPMLGLILAASSKGEAVLVDLKTKKATSSTHLTVNPACAAWHPTTAIFCLTGLEGTSTSYDGKTWTLNEDAPHDLRELSYREDLDSFLAWSGEDKTFYASTDGINWTQLSDTPIPLDNISTVHYEPNRKWYCAVGIGDGHAYFSKDLKHWIGTKLRNNSPVDVGDVIYMPSTDLFVAMPTSGTYYYTFNPSNWTD